MIFELSRFEFEVGQSEQVELRLTLKNGAANTLEIQNPFENAVIVIESIKRVNSSNSTELWLTTDSILFANNIPQTAWVISNNKSTFIHTATALQNGDQVFVRFLISVPTYNQSAIEDVLSASSLTGIEKHMFVEVSLSSSPGAFSTYVSAKPILLKHQGSVK
ncbi:hypothetical protein JNM05_09505 [bacterium]|nr:hypothetical protein [bacterium]